MILKHEWEIPFRGRPFLEKKDKQIGILKEDIYDKEKRMD